MAEREHPMWSSCILIFLLHYILLTSAQIYEDGAFPGEIRPVTNAQRQQDSLVVQLLSAVRGNPQNLSPSELRTLRETTPAAAEHFIQLMNHEKLLDDVSQGKVEKRAFEDLTLSLVFMETAQCGLSHAEPTKTCLILRQPIIFPKDPIVAAKLSVFVKPQVKTCDVRLKLHFLDHAKHRFTKDVFNLPGSSSQLLGLFTQFKRTKQEVTWDITAAVADLKSHMDQDNYPVLMTMECSTAVGDIPWNMLAYNKDILMPNRQAIIELLTEQTLQLKTVYGRRRLSSRSPGTDANKHNLCPSFMDGERHVATCCLFEFTLNKQQMDANPKLRFIIFPQHLPLNMCHGRCIGTQMDWRNSHVMLLNRYFEGLPPEEREVLYDSMPCCAANQTAPFTIVYKNQNNQLTTETLPNAKKISCACG